MGNTFAIGITLFFAVAGFNAKAQVTPAADQICGKWMSAEKNLIVQMYRDNHDFIAMMVWCRTEGDSRPMQEWTDLHNPDKALRRRKIVGMNVLDGLVYRPESNSWEGGKIYDALHGRTWDASVCLAKNGALKVTGYWHFKFIGRTITFNKVSDFEAMSIH